ncbi:MAG TPA: circadian clock KaiB family protein [Thermoanaerobaculia bacterium]
MSERRKPAFKLCLYIADHTPNSDEARSNLTALCARHLAGRHEIEIVDVLLHPERALQSGVLMTPTLIKLLPLPERRLVGTLGRTEAVMLALGIEALE